MYTVYKTHARSQLWLNVKQNYGWFAALADSVNAKISYTRWQSKKKACHSPKASEPRTSTFCASISVRCMVSEMLVMNFCKENSYISHTHTHIHEHTDSSDEFECQK